MSSKDNNKPVTLSSDLTVLSGIGEKTAGLFHQCGIDTVGDLLRAYPRTYDRYEPPVTIADLTIGEVRTVAGTVKGPVRIGRNRKLAVTSTTLTDLSGSVNVCWFRLPYIRKMIHSGQPLILRGSCVNNSRGLTLTQPELFTSTAKYEEKQGTMQPVYRRTAGLSNQAFMKAVSQALPALSQMPDPLDDEIRTAYQLMPLDEAIKAVHFPEDDATFSRGRDRLCFDEFLQFILRLRYFSENSQEKARAFPLKPGALTKKLLGSLPYELTEGQKEAYEDIVRDIGQNRAMSRLIQGDVGCGKTILAILALLSAVDSGAQGALMAPTQVLAVQHYQTLAGMFDKYGIDCRIDLLTGTTPSAQRREIYERMSDGRAQIFIGTQALIQKNTDFSNLALVVTDEQHRFGVRQRMDFANKGDDAYSPHILVMSATPIPRTLGIILYGDLSVSRIREMPAGRLPVKNAVIHSAKRAQAFKFIRDQIKEGRQAYCICPLVDDSETLDARSVTGYIDILKSALGDKVRVEMLHGRMKGTDKDRILTEFAAGGIDVLVSTTVIEVGINVPNASVMLIENADRFGLAQLHQLRGRIGRGSYQSYCIFLTSRSDKKVMERLDVIGHCNDGFEIAQEDLRLRGPGDLFGLRQSGFLQFEIGDIFQDHDILTQAASAADRILEDDPLLTKPPHRLLAEQMTQTDYDVLTETERTL